MKRCTLLVGLPCSGKSTAFPGAYGTDSIIESMCIVEGLTYNEGFSRFYGSAEKIMWERLTKARSRGDCVIIDRTNLTVKSRKRFIDFFVGYEFEAIVFTTSLEECLRRNTRPGKIIPVIKQMDSSFVMPTLSEGFTRICLA